ncbi:MAG: hypothetical protein ACYDEB_08560 [Dehalococcoidia bacterium]
MQDMHAFVREAPALRYGAVEGSAPRPVSQTSALPEPCIWYPL